MLAGASVRTYMSCGGGLSWTSAMPGVASAASRGYPNEGGVPSGSVVKNPLQYRRPGFSPWVGKIPWRRKWLPTPVFLPGKSYRQRSLEGCSPWARKELDTT